MRKSERPQMLYKRDIRKMKNDIYYKTQVLLFAFLMDELNYSAERIIEVKEALDRYLEAIDKKLLTVEKVEKIIEEYTELKMIKKG